MSTNAFQLLIKQIPALASPVLFNIGTTMAQRVADDNQRLYRENDFSVRLGLTTTKFRAAGLRRRAIFSNLKIGENS